MTEQVKNHTNIKATIAIKMQVENIKHIRDVKSIANLIAMYDNTDIVKVLLRDNEVTSIKGYGAITGIYLDNDLVKLRISARIAGQYTSKELAKVVIAPVLSMDGDLYILDSLMFCNDLEVTLISNCCEIDPFDDYLDKGRSTYLLGGMADDVLANEVFINGNAPLNLDGIVAGTHYSSGTYLQAAKERIRWLSRQLLDVKFKEASAVADPF